MIEYYGSKKLSTKVIASLLVVSFLWYDIAWAGDLFYYNIEPNKVSVVPQIPAEVTHYDLLSSNKNKSVAPGLLPTSQDKEQSNKFAPAYIQDQQEKHEGIIRQKQDTEDLMLTFDQDLRNKINKPEEEGLELKKKRSSPEANLGPGGIYYTLEDYDQGGKPGQINVYKYEGDNARSGKLLEIISYDVSGLETNPFVGSVKEIKTDDGNSFMGSYSQVPSTDGLNESTIISRTVYSGATKGKERIDYILSGYDEDDIPGEVTIYDYSRVSGSSLDETRTYNTKMIELDYSNSSFKNQLTEDRMIRLSVYTGADKKEKVSYVLDTYVIGDEDGKNAPHQVVIYDYDKASGEALDEV
ncbi:MAG: hypothetical protein KKH77_03885, partial [Candidatus Omnitrophica bacterium]|nr:hypothetical protein [Candidatus Omnitrophota bacterium]